MMLPKKLSCFLLVCICLFSCIALRAQKKDSINKSLVKDSSKLDFVAKMQAFAKGKE